MDYLASLVCDAACIDQTLRAKLEHYVNEMIFVSMICVLLKHVFPVHIAEFLISYQLITNTTLACVF